MAPFVSPISFKFMLTLPVTISSLSSFHANVHSSRPFTKFEASSTFGLCHARQSHLRPHPIHRFLGTLHSYRCHSQCHHHMQGSCHL
ncbi:hypothetical protein EDB86DRAFT_2996806 [Lactarius hatsudake]|nr:hypothetical protein EDB86DRAFT_2996806 [Lactarius hatsudake]